MIDHLPPMPTAAFFGRAKELAALNALYAEPRTIFVPVYGRRRVGKSELILQFAQKKPALYFLGKQAPAHLQLREFLQEAGRALDEPLLATASVDGWKHALQLVLQHAAATPAKKFVLALDEFQWMVGASPELPSVLQELLDRDWKSRRNVMLILCGSYLGFMERDVLGEQSPLFGRRSAQILLRPFPYYEAADFHAQWEWQDRAKAYFLCGGIPQYLLCFSTKESIAKNIERNFLHEFAPLFREPDFLLREELREVQNYYAILIAMAQGAVVGKAIAQYAGIDERKLHYYVDQLIKLGYVRRHYPLSHHKPTTRQVRFILDDPLLLFWFRFVYPHLTAVMQLGPREAYRTLIAPHLDAYFGKRFETLCREALPLLYQREGIHTPFEVGEYWNAHVQIDVVGYRTREGIDLGECKWGTLRSPAQAIAELEQKIRHYPNPEGLSVRRHMFTRLPVSAKSHSATIRFHHLAALYRLGSA